MVKHGRLLRQAHRVVKGQLIDHDPEAYAAGMPGHSAQVDTGGGDLAHGGILVLNDKIVAVAQRLGQLDLTDVLLIDVSMHRRSSHLVCPESIPDTECER
jgi:hypothetical protein